MGERADEVAVWGEQRGHVCTLNAVISSLVHCRLSSPCLCYYWESVSHLSAHPSSVFPAHLYRSTRCYTPKCLLFFFSTVIRERMSTVSCYYPLLSSIFIFVCLFWSSPPGLSCLLCLLFRCLCPRAACSRSPNESDWCRCCLEDGAFH